MGTLTTQNCRSHLQTKYAIKERIQPKLVRSNHQLSDKTNEHKVYFTQKILNTNCRHTELAWSGQKMYNSRFLRLRRTFLGKIFFLLFRGWRGGGARTVSFLFFFLSSILNFPLIVPKDSNKTLDMRQD